MKRIECDRCGKQVEREEDLWLVEIQPLKKHRNIDDRRYTRRELCKRCRDSVYVKMMEV